MFPAAALADWLNCESDNQVAEILGLGSGSVSRWRIDGRMFTAYEADRHATRLNVHPVEIWPDWFDHEILVAT